LYPAAGFCKYGDGLSAFIRTEILLISISMTPRRYPYFDVVVGLVWSYDPESYASGSVAAGRISHAGQVQTKKGYPGLPGWGLGIAGSHKRGQGSSWTVALEEEEEEEEDEKEEV
jgi:hypothetical protein